MLAGLDCGIEALANIMVIWPFTGTWLLGAGAERRAQLIEVSFNLLAPYVAPRLSGGLGQRATPKKA